MTNNIIIGTAGHVDHGKTQLIRALTGIDTDWHKEEKERGISIELGFAYFTLDSGQRCGIIDVPGHERFVANMLAGAGTIDLALFVVAADEGMMPQSREHLEILSLLGIKKGIIVLTKKDLTQQDWRDLVIMDIKEEVAGTFLESAPIVEVSAITGQGMDALKQTLSDMIEKTPSKDTGLAPRLHVDRVFSKSGFGTVVTGTLIEGSIKVGSELSVYPSMQKAKVRGLQVHTQSVETAYHGQRVAVNLSGIKVADIPKGSTLAAPNSMQNTTLLDVRLDIAPRTERIISNNSRLHFYHGSGETLCRLVLIDENELIGKQSAYAQLVLQSPIAAKVGDRFVVRFYSPMETIGGGIILDNLPQKRSRNVKKIREMFNIKENGNLSQRIACFILDKSQSFPSLEDIKRLFFSDTPLFEDAFDGLVQSSEVILINNAVIHKDYLRKLGQKCTKILQEFHKDNPMLSGMKKDELRGKLLPQMSVSDVSAILELLKTQGIIKSTGQIVALTDFNIVLSESQKRLTNEVSQAVLEAGFSPPSLDELAQKLSCNKKEFVQIMDALVAQEVFIMLTAQIAIHADIYKQAIKIVANLAKDGEFTLAEFRDAIQSSRKYALAFLEHFDNKGITRKQGENRVFLEKQRQAVN